MDIDIINKIYVTNVNKLLQFQLNFTRLGWFQNTFYINQKVECFKSFILTQKLCINFCSVKGKTNKFAYVQYTVQCTIWDY